MLLEIENGILKKGWTADVAEVTIPDDVTSIEESAFENCTTLTSITISDSVKNIGNRAFYNCEKLIDITIPESVESIGNMAFENCTTLTSINVSEKNQNFCSLDGVLYNKDMTILIKYPIAKETVEFIIHDGVKSISNEAFSWCERLISIIIPNSIASIGNSTFAFC